METGHCPGIENYARWFSGKKPGEPPYTLLDFFPKDMLLVVDESHATLPQVRAMFAGDHSRKTTLVEHGFRLAEPPRQSTAPLRRVGEAARHRPLHVGDARGLRAGTGRRRNHRAGGPADGARRSGHSGAAGARTGRRSHDRDQEARRAEGADAGDARSRNGSQRISPTTSATAASAPSGSTPSSMRSSRVQVLA